MFVGEGRGVWFVLKETQGKIDSEMGGLLPRRRVLGAGKEPHSRITAGHSRHDVSSRTAPWALYFHGLTTMNICFQYLCVITKSVPLIVALAAKVLFT